LILPLVSPVLLRLWLLLLQRWSRVLCPHQPAGLAAPAAAAAAGLALWPCCCPACSQARRGAVLTRTPLPAHCSCPKSLCLYEGSARMQRRLCVGRHCGAWMSVAACSWCRSAIASRIRPVRAPTRSTQLSDELPAAVPTLVMLTVSFTVSSTVCRTDGRGLQLQALLQLCKLYFLVLL
jgi:hypothetical protein